MQTIVAGAGRGGGMRMALRVAAGGEPFEHEDAQPAGGGDDSWKAAPAPTATHLQGRMRCLQSECVLVCN